MSAALRMEKFIGNNRRKQVLAIPKTIPTELRHRSTGATARLMVGVLLLICMQLMSSTKALAWTPFERKTLYEEVELSAAEAK